MSFSAVRKVCKNPLAWYAVKSGLFSEAHLTFRVPSGTIRLVITKRLLMHEKTRSKALLRLLVCGALDAAGNDVVYLSNGGMTILKGFQPSHAETVENLKNCGIPFADHDSDHYRAVIGTTVFYPRKAIASDSFVFGETFVRHEYGFIDNFIKGSTVLDVGANVGDTALYFVARGAQKVVAFEPHPELFGLAKKNIDANVGDARVELASYGVGKEDGEIECREDNDDGPTGTFGLTGRQVGRKVTLKIKSFSGVLDAYPKADVVKMDCEGAEYGAFESCTDEQLRRICVFAIEYHRGDTVLVDRLRGAGFEVSRISGDDVAGLLCAKRI
jgi:FkbM family methyltransferase